MKQKHLWLFLLILGVTVFFGAQMIPPTGRDLLQDFQQKARSKDAAYSNVVARAQQLQKEFPGRTYGNLKEAIGTNDITKYFPQINPKGQKNPSAFVLNQLQREAAGRIK